MPQEIPVEASETLDFIPDCFAALDAPPKFTLRAPTTREKRVKDRLINEEVVERHSTEALRAEMLAGLKLLWAAEDYERLAPILEAYWQACDDYELQARANPDLEWQYDAEIERACEQLEKDVARLHKPFARMRADNAEFAEVAMLATVAAVVKGWTGLALEPKRERGYLTVDSVHELRGALIKLDTEHGVTPGTAWAQLLVACSRRMFLDEETEKNSASPSPSEPPPPNSKTGASRNGKSPASASSTETPESE